MGIQQQNTFARWMAYHPVVSSIVLVVLGIVIGVIGVMGITSSSSDSAKLDALRAQGGNTQSGTPVGSVVEVEEGSHGRQDHATYCPEYAYTGADGAQRTIVDRSACESSKSDLTTETIDIIVDPADPTTAFIDEDDASVGRSTLTIFAWSMLALGAGMLVSAPIVFVRGRRRSARAATGAHAR